MKKELKAHTKIFTVSLLLLTAFTFVSCEYAVLEGFYRKHNVSERAASLYSLPDSEAPDPTLAKKNILLQPSATFTFTHQSLPLATGILLRKA